MQQLSLDIRDRLSYSPENFIVHGGIVKAIEATLGLVQQDFFKLCFFVGPARSGKTHLSIKLASMLAERGHFPRVVDGREFASWCSERAPEMRRSAQKEDALLIDDIDEYFKHQKRGNSGQFVDLVETLRPRCSAIFLFSSSTIPELEADEHVLSRIKPGSGFYIGEPGRDDMAALIGAMGKQRGLELSERQIAYLSKRLRNEVGSIEECLCNVNHLSKVLGKHVGLPLLGDALFVAR